MAMTQEKTMETRCKKCFKVMRLVIELTLEGEIKYWHCRVCGNNIYLRV